MSRKPHEEPPSPTELPFECFLTEDAPLMIRPGQKQRDWMDESENAYAYRCLPLSMANQHGWQLECPVGFEAEWSGESHERAIRIRVDGDQPSPVVSHFRSGILTFQHPAIFRTPPGLNLWVCGPPNAFKDAIQPLTGLVETDWLPFTFTMNWKFTRANTVVRFEAGEPYCFIFPVPRGLVEQCAPALRQLSDDPALERQHRIAHNRRDFGYLLRRQPGYELPKPVRWQGWYTNGQYPDRSGSAPEHQRGLDVRPFEPREASGGAAPAGDRPIPAPTPPQDGPGD